jgi:outer membrane biosynthesis protein TonB
VYFDVIGKLFGNKKQAYFLELDEASSQSAPESTPTAAPVPAAAPVATEAPKAVQVKEPKVAKVKEPQAAKVKATEPQAPAPKVEAPAPAPVPTVKNFSTDYMIGNTMTRRRPGPSLATFMDMAKDMRR